MVAQRDVCSAAACEPSRWLGEPAASLYEDYFKYEDAEWRRWETHKDEDTRSASSSSTMDEAVDFEVLAYMAATEDGVACCSPTRRAAAAARKANDLAAATVSGLPLVCGNCGVSFFSLQIPDDQVDCYCSGECKWSVIMYQEMDRRMLALRYPASRHDTNSTCSSSYEDEADEDEGDAYDASGSHPEDDLYVDASFQYSHDGVSCH